MIIYKYFTKEVLKTLLAVTVMLVTIFLVNQVIRWLNAAASGDLASNVLIKLVLLEIPYLLGLLLPLGLFLGILITYGRFYVENEMTILFASGMSRKQLTNITLTIATIIFLCVSILVFWINPVIAKKQSTLLQVSADNLVGSLVPGRFQTLQNDSRVIYVEKISDGSKKKARNVFIAQLPDASTGNTDWTVLSADTGYQQHIKNKGNFVVAENGYRYQGTPGEHGFQVAKFDKYGIKLPRLIGTQQNMIDEQGMSTWALLKDRTQSLSNFSELQWRLAMPISVYVLALLAMVLSKVKPRQGRFKQLVPAILFYIVYANLIFVGREWLEDGVVPSVLGLWWVHGLMLLLTSGVAYWQSRRPSL